MLSEVADYRGWPTTRGVDLSGGFDVKNARRVHRLKSIMRS